MKYKPAYNVYWPAERGHNWVRKQTLQILFFEKRTLINGRDIFQNATLCSIITVAAQQFTVGFHQKLFSHTIKDGKKKEIMGQIYNTVIVHNKVTYSTYFESGAATV